MINWENSREVRFEASGVELEGKCFGPSPEDAPTIVLLHEGLGSVRLWRDFPEQLVAATGFGVFAYSRQGYGASDPVSLPRPINYMDLEAQNSVSDVLSAIYVQDYILLGHSDGASIATIYAGLEDVREGLKGVILMAPHFFAEPEGVDAISKIRKAYDEGLKEKLAKYHGHVDGAFLGWNDTWLHPEFMEWNIEGFLPNIRVPVLMIQGEDDEYGTFRQVEALKSGLKGTVEVEYLADCGHAPHQEKEAETLDAIKGFIGRWA